MLKYALTVIATAACCFAIAATTGLGATTAKHYVLTAGSETALPSDNLYCDVLKTTEVGCGSKLAVGAVLAYFSPTEIDIVKFTNVSAKGAPTAELLYDTKR